MEVLIYELGIWPGFAAEVLDPFKALPLPSVRVLAPEWEALHNGIGQPCEGAPGTTHNLGTAALHVALGGGVTDHLVAALGQHGTVPLRLLSVEGARNVLLRSTIHQFHAVDVAVLGFELDDHRVIICCTYLVACIRVHGDTDI